MVCSGTVCARSARLSSRSYRATSTRNTFPSTKFRRSTTRRNCAHKPRPILHLPAVARTARFRCPSLGIRTSASMPSGVRNRWLLSNGKHFSVTCSSDAGWQWRQRQQQRGREAVVSTAYFRASALRIYIDTTTTDARYACMICGDVKAAIMHGTEHEMGRSSDGERRQSPHRNGIMARRRTVARFAG